MTRSDKTGPKYFQQSETAADTRFWILDSEQLDRITTSTIYTHTHRHEKCINSFAQ